MTISISCGSCAESRALIHENILSSVGVEVKNRSSSQDSEQRRKPGVGVGRFTLTRSPGYFHAPSHTSSRDCHSFQGNVACSFLGGWQPPRHRFLLKKISLLAQAKLKNFARIKPTFFDPDLMKAHIQTCAVRIRDTLGRSVSKVIC